MGCTNDANGGEAISWIGLSLSKKLMKILPNPQQVPPTPQASHTLSTIKLPILKKEGLHKGYDRFQSLLSQLETHGAGVSTEDANHKFLRSLPYSWSQVSLITRTKPGVDTLSFDDLYNNLRVFKSDVKSQLDHGDLEQVDEFDLEEMDSKWQDEHKAMVTIDGEGIDWSGHAEDETKDYVLMAFNSSNSSLDTKKLLAEGEKEKEELKNKLENFQSSSKGLSKLLNSQMSAKDKSGLRSNDVEDSLVNDRFVKVKGMHAVLPPMTVNYMPPKSDFGIDDSSEETLKTVPKPVESKPKVVNEPKVWSDAPIIEEYESDSDDEYVSKALVEQEKPSCAFIDTVKHDNPHPNLKGKCIVDSGCSKHMTGNKAYLVDYQDFYGGPVTFGGSKGQITEFKNMDIIEFCGSKGIKREYSNARTLQQNGVAERKNETLIEATRTMLANSFLPNTFLAEAVSTACYVFNRYKFPLPVKIVTTARRKEMPLPEVCTAIEEKKKKLPVKDRWQLH
nr:ribonuclease H-like domain-containing protein [Tanacetum cinerariifolium]